MMGLGDFLMATADAKRLNEQTGKPVVVLGRNGAIQWSEVFDHNPRLRRAPVNCAVLRNGPGMRPYIAGRTDHKWTWRPGQVKGPGEIYLHAKEKDFGASVAGMVVVEPNVKNNGHRNKAWPFERWQALVDLKVAPMVQCGVSGTRWLDGVKRVETNQFRQALAVLSVSRGFVGTEGAMHHAAAALSVPSVVLWSEFISPAVTGYEAQRNLRHAGEPCGCRVPCEGCAASMDAISVEEVADNLRAIL